MRIERVQDSLEIAVGSKYESNAAIFYNGDEVLLVDAMGSRGDAEELRKYLGRKRVRFVVATHYFSDHMAGLALFPEALVIAHGNYSQTFESELYRTDEEAGFFVSPSIVIRDSMKIKWGAHTLEIFLNAGHTMSTLNIDVPEADVVFTADNVVGNIVYLAYSSPGLIGAALQELSRRGRSRVISSHGGLYDRQRIEVAIEYLERLETSATIAWKESNERVCSISIDECLPGDIGGTDFEKVFHARNLDCILERRLFCS